jgi:hypothetical protein
VAATGAPPAIRPADFLAIDALLSDEERDIRNTVRAFVRDRESVVTYEGTADVHACVIGQALTGIQAFR